MVAISRSWTLSSPQDFRTVYLWRAVDAEGEVLDVLVQSKRNKRVALKLMRKLLKKCGFVPNRTAAAQGTVASHRRLAGRM
jgi:transposase-like protein